MAWLADYTKRKKITIDNTKVDATLTDFPVLVALSADAQIGAVSNADGFDIRFTSSDGTTLLKYERENFAIASDLATGNFWVKVPSVSSSANTEIYIYYRATDTADGADPANVWDSNFKMVQHMKDATTSTILDSTSNDTDGAKKAANEPIEADGKIGKGQSFDGANDNVVMGNKLGFDRTDPFTLEAVVKLVTEEAHFVMAKQRQGSPFEGYNLLLIGLLKDKTKIQFNLINTAETKHLQVTEQTGSLTSADVYYHVVVTYDGSGNASGAKIYSDGAERTVDTGYDNLDGATTNTIDFKLGIRDTLTVYFFKGIMDEARISNTARSAAWVKASYNSNFNTLLSLGSEETETPTATRRRAAFMKFF